MENPSNNEQVMLVRQPVFDQDLKIVAYQIRYQSRTEAEWAFYGDDEAASRLLLTSFTSLSQNGKQMRVPVFLPFPHQMMGEGTMPELPKRELVIEIPSNVVVDDALLSQIEKLSEEGYRLALDGFALQKELIPLVKLVNIVKVDTSAVHPKLLLKIGSILRRRNITMQAQNIPNFEVLRLCRRLGFKLYHGSFLGKPSKVLGKEMPGNSAVLLQLTQKLRRDDITAKEIESLVVADPVLTFKILRVVNSAAYNLTNQINSLEQAIVLLGQEQIRRWALLIAMNAQEDKPEEMSRNLLVRGRMCELVCESAEKGNPESAFMVGVVSQLDVLLEVEMGELLKQVPLDDETRAALLDHEGPLGEVLTAVIQFEDADFDSLRESGIDKQFLDVAYRHSLKWAENAMQALAEESGA